MSSLRRVITGVVMALLASCSDGSPGPKLDRSSDAATSPDTGAASASSDVATIPDAGAALASSDVATIPDAGAATVSGFVDPALANREATPMPARQGLQYSGSVALFSITKTGPDDQPDASAEAWVELSAAILPKTKVLYAGEGSNYPTTQQGQAKLAHDSALTFATLLRECQPLYPGIVLWQEGDAPLSDAQVFTNYQQLEACAYERYLAKPYWIPQLIQDVDICRQEIGPGWRMPTEADVLRLSGASVQIVQETLDGVQNASSHPGSWYFSLAVWVLRDDGTVGAATLQPGGAPGITSLISSNGMPFDPRVHYEGGLTLRCLRVTSLLLSSL